MFLWYSIWSATFQLALYTIRFKFFPTLLVVCQMNEMSTHNTTVVKALLSLIKLINLTLLTTGSRTVICNTTVLTNLFFSYTVFIIRVQQSKANWKQLCTDYFFLCIWLFTVLQRFPRASHCFGAISDLLLIKCVLSPSLDIRIHRYTYFWLTDSRQFCLCLSDCCYLSRRCNFRFFAVDVTTLQFLLCCSNLVISNRFYWKELMTL